MLGVTGQQQQEGEGEEQAGRVVVGFPLSSMMLKKEMLDRKGELTPRSAAAVAERMREVGDRVRRDRGAAMHGWAR